MRKRLLAQAKEKTTPNSELDSPEPWFDLSTTAPNSMSTQHTKDTRYDKDEPLSPVSGVFGTG
jgi:hypothetical protein